MNQLSFRTGRQSLATLFDRLFPITRSITGPGVRETLNILAEDIPFTIKGVASGTKVLDWTVPDEWTLNSARL